MENTTLSGCVCTRVCFGFPADTGRAKKKVENREMDFTFVVIFSQTGAVAPIDSKSSCKQ